MFDNPSICQACGGRCCQRMPGFYHPNQLGNTDEEIKQKLIEMFKTQNFSIDAWEGDPTGKPYNFDDENSIDRVYMIRPRAKGRDLFDFPWLIDVCECTFFLAASGCTLPSDARPMQCQLLEPKPDGKCQEHFTMGRHGKHEAALRWLPYQSVIRFVITELNLE